ncbi:MAG: flavin reductase family protein [Caldisphaera sp.]|jgi:flavin reductase (DIM6/NTAB) family NADH-FMN oxidoreductase RutF|nr:flavin reductase family protein [Caldisphaera sp.]
MDPKELLKSFMRYSAKQVYVVTSKGERGYSAITVSASTGVSLNPPLILISIDKESINHDKLINSRYFILTLLSDNDKQISRIMAEKKSPEKKLKIVGFEETDYGPILKIERPYLVLKFYRSCEGGDHTIILGEIIGGKINNIEKPLVYFNRNYTTIKNENK